MYDISILQKGNLYFFYRPKFQENEVHTPNDVQRFYIVLKPENLSEYITLIVGRKRLPKSATYFAFVENVSQSLDKLMDKLKKLSNETSVYKVQYTNPAVCLAEGKYILINHEQHTHLCYHITSPSTLGDVQHQFNLKTQDDYLITVKNPQHDSPPGTGLASSQKAKYPTRLQDMLGDYRFLPLITPEFLNFEGAELLLIGKGKTDLENTEIDVEKCLHQISDDVLTKHFKIIKDPLPITNVL